MIKGVRPEGNGDFSSAAFWSEPVYRTVISGRALGEDDFATVVLGLMMAAFSTFAGVVGAVVAVCLSLEAQNRPVVSPSFDVTSVKPSDPSITSGGFRRLDAGVMVISGMTLKELILNAYSLRDYQISIKDRWIDTTRYDVTGKDTSLPAMDTQQLTEDRWVKEVNADYERLKTLLAERFHLQTHVEQSTTRAYDLVVKKPERLRSGVCLPGYRLGRGQAKGNMKLSSVGAELSVELGRRVKDATGLSGCYEIDLRWTLDPTEGQGISVASALHELGLGLEPTVAVTNILIVDHAERPLPD